MDVFEAAEGGDLERVRALVEQDEDLMDATDDEGWPPLFYAADGGHLEVARYLLDHGASISHRGAHQETALYLACRSQHAGLVLFLLQRGADVSAGDEWGQTPLMIAVASYASARVLLEHGGSDVDAAAENGQALCHWACAIGQSGVLRQLLEAGADPIVYTKSGRPAIHYAARRGDPHFMRVLRGWHRAYTLYRARSIRETSSAVAASGAPVDAAPPYLINRAMSGLTMPVVHVHAQEQFGQLSDDMGLEEGAERNADVVDEYGQVELDCVGIGGEGRADLDPDVVGGKEHVELNHVDGGGQGHVELDTDEEEYVD